MVRAGVGRRQQQEDEIDRQPVDRAEIDRRREPGEMADTRGRPSSLPCGIAAPPPKPVEPSFSRALRQARIAFWSSPVRRAAAAPTSWNNAFLLATTRSASTASVGENIGKIVHGAHDGRGGPAKK